MTDQQQTPPGWYPRPSMPGSLGYWDGEKWTDHVAPTQPPAPARRPSGVNAWVIAAGVLIAAFAIWLVYGIATANDGLECATDNADRALSGQSSEDCD